MSSKTLRGSCLCGKVTYKVDLPDPPDVNFCYCSHCRKSSASLFDAYVIIPKTAMTIEKGQELLTTHSIKGDSGDPVKRIFCKECGTRLYGTCDNPVVEKMFDGFGALTMGIGTLDVPVKEMDGWKKAKEYYKDQKVLIKLN